MESEMSVPFHDLTIDISNTDFRNEVLLELDSVLEDLFGKVESTSFLNIVATKLAESIISKYEHALGKRHFSVSELANLLVDLKQRIGGQFRIVDITSTSIRLRNSRCPFGERVRGNPSMCSMTSTVFGRIITKSANYAAVSIPKSIAKGHDGCDVVISLEPNVELNEHTQEYFKVEHP